MNQEINQILFALLRSAICGEPMADSQKSLFSEDMLVDLLTVSSKHDIAHLVSQGLYANNLIEAGGGDSESGKKLYKAQLMAIYRYERINYDLEMICDALETAQIPFIPLKGSVLRRYYPEPWMRTSCDIDVLVHEKDLENAVDFLIKNCECKLKRKGPHDVSIYTLGGQHLELHYRLIEDGVVNASDEVLKQTWDRTTVKNGYSYFREMTDEMFYFYHVAHMAKHFQIGGCGIRTFIDLWILDHIEWVAQTKRDELIEQGGLSKFYSAVRKLSQVWFDGAELDELSSQLQSYILFGGVYGTNENRIAIQQQKKGGKVRYVLSKIFLPYDSLKYHYPILEKHRWLMPFMQVRRWFKLVFCGHAKRVIRELDYNQNLSSEDAARTKAFLDDLGL